MTLSAVLKKSIPILILAVAVAAFTLMFADARQLAGALRGMDTRYLPLIALFIPADFFLRVLHFHYYLRCLGARVRVRDEILAVLSSLVMVVTPAKLGEMLMRGYLLSRRYDLPMATTAALLFAERLSAGLALVLLALASLVAMNMTQGLPAILIVFAGLAAIVAVIQNRRWCRAALALISRAAFLKKHADTFSGFYESARRVFELTPLLVSIGIGVALWGCEGAVVYLTARALSGEMSVAQAVFAVSFSGIAGSLSMMPAGMIAADGTLLGLFAWMGLSRPVSGATVLISRFSTIWLGVIVGGAALFFVQRAGLLGGDGPENAAARKKAE